MIPKRVFWFAAGVATGFGGAAYGYARVREARGRLAADQVAGTVADAVVGSARSARGAARSLRTTVREALDEGRGAMDEAGLRIEHDLERGR